MVQIWSYYHGPVGKYFFRNQDYPIWVKYFNTVLEAIFCYVLKSYILSAINISKSICSLVIIVNL